MTITSIRLQNFKSYSDSSFDFDSGVNIIVGANASGKTNLIDALHFLSTGKFIKTSKDYTIKHGNQWSRVDVLTSTNQPRILKHKKGLKPEITVEDKTYKRLPLDRSLPIVVFEPSQLFFITTSPDMRRQFIDDIITKTDSQFSAIKNSYSRLLKQRNSLLKQPTEVIKQQIFAWDVRLAETAGRYVLKRVELIKQLNFDTSVVYSSIAGSKHSLLLEYDSKVSNQNYASDMLKGLQKNLELDQLRGFTGLGPHRDDISIKIDDQDMRDLASRGETRSILLTLKILESKKIEDIFQQKPIFLLDDVFGELDGSRRKSLIDFISNNQAFITTTDADVISHKLINAARSIVIT